LRSLRTTVPGDLKLIVEFENRKLKPDGLPLGDFPPGLDINPGGTDILDNLPEYALLDGVLRDNKGRATGKSAQVWTGFVYSWFNRCNLFDIRSLSTTIFFQPRTHSKPRSGRNQPAMDFTDPGRSSSVIDTTASP
jgi:hypothetical protein